MTYDPQERRDTPLALKLKERIRRDGPISVAEYMEACLQDPEHGYYRTKAAIGAKGDFVTAPEISQVFGELIGLWCAVVWQQMGSPSKFNLVELGPGRGTLMADALRATRIVPGFHEAADVLLVESNAALRDEQRRVLASHARVRWGERLSELEGDAPALIIGNEFLDALPVTQFESVLDDDVPCWRERIVELDSDGRFEFATRVQTTPVAEFWNETNEAAPAGAVSEYAFAYNIVTGPLCMLAHAQPLAALFIDYGGAGSSLSNTLQAVRGHSHEHVLASPGEADLTAMVRFDELAGAFLGASVAMSLDGPVPQTNFLGALGIMQRAAKLMSANPAKAHEIEAGVARLMAVPGMGDRFKALGIRSSGLPPLPGFEA